MPPRFSRLPPAIAFSALPSGRALRQRLEGFAPSRFPSTRDNRGGLRREPESWTEVPAYFENYTSRVLPVSSSCIMASLRARVFSRRCSHATSSASISVSTSAMAVCSSFVGGNTTVISEKAGQRRLVLLSAEDEVGPDLGFFAF